MLKISLRVHWPFRDSSHLRCQRLCDSDIATFLRSAHAFICFAWNGLERTFKLNLRIYSSPYSWISLDPRGSLVSMAVLYYYRFPLNWWVLDLPWPFGDCRHITRLHYTILFSCLASILPFLDVIYLPASTFSLNWSAIHTTFEIMESRCL